MFFSQSKTIMPLRHQDLLRVRENEKTLVKRNVNLIFIIFSELPYNTSKEVVECYDLLSSEVTTHEWRILKDICDFMWTYLEVGKEELESYLFQGC